MDLILIIITKMLNCLFLLIILSQLVDFTSQSNTDYADGATATSINNYLTDIVDYCIDGKPDGDLSTAYDSFTRGIEIDYLRLDMGATQTIASIWLISKTYDCWVDVYIGEDSTDWSSNTKCAEDFFFDGIIECVGSGRYIHIV